MPSKYEIRESEYEIGRDAWEIRREGDEKIRGERGGGGRFADKGMKERAKTREERGEESEK